jgi:hypothetical protein
VVQGSTLLAMAWSTRRCGEGRVCVRSDTEVLVKSPGYPCSWYLLLIAPEPLCVVGWTWVVLPSKHRRIDLIHQTNS